eukprot:COSAG06_NODE_1996_length_7886_cov_6.036985_9_plen_60_part_00
MRFSRVGPLCAGSDSVTNVRVVGSMDANHKVLPLPTESKPYISNFPEVKVRPVQVCLPE